ncbi:hypothetical protein EST38_g5908 [Candolleomyces aberdarensis]|uniref:Uncharacterized protein n=1 Tax=Candolleomyces aberdarensis TaxID=2316362 RepID=A0A4Q2DL70_9AGAR|nr:hypothetical protein EST38_g5908 [Candolleomyces aberdarensis]
MSSSLLQRFKAIVVTKNRATTAQRNPRNQIEDLPKVQPRRSQVRLELDTHCFAPIIDRIDDDVLTYIFLTALENEDPANPPMSRAHPAVVVAHVCHRWREVALATRALWQQIHLFIPEYPKGWIDGEHHQWEAWNTRLLQQRRMIKTWISRSGESPLSVKVSEGGSFSSANNGGYYVEDAFSELTGLMNTLCRTSFRWKELDLGMTFGEFQTRSFPTARFLSLPSQVDPVLATVKLDINWRSESLSPLMISNPSILGAASLRSLVISKGAIPHDLMALPVLWSSLKHLDFHGYPSTSTEVLNESKTLQVLKACPNLVSCYFAMNDSGSAMISLTPPITLRFLKEMTLRPYTWHVTTNFASSLNLPHLHKLSIQSISGSSCSPRNYEDSGLCEFIERFGSTLRNVGFQHITLTQDALLRCLSNLPEVVSLTLFDAFWATVFGNCARIDGDFFRSLTPRLDESDAPVYSRIPKGYLHCPMMEELALSSTFSGGALEEKALVDFIEARRTVDLQSRGADGVRTAARLKRVTSGVYWLRTLDVMEELRRRGVDVDGFSFKCQ